jgi:hypothetical protein
MCRRFSEGSMIAVTTTWILLKHKENVRSERRSCVRASRKHRHLDHLLYTLALDVELATVPTTVLEERAVAAFPMPNRKTPKP